MPNEIDVDIINGEKLGIVIPDAYARHVGPAAMEALRAFVLKMYAAGTRTNRDQWAETSLGKNNGF